MGNDVSIDFENNQKYNNENQVSMRVDIPKTCYFKGESIEGKIFLKGKEDLKQTHFISPSASITLKEIYQDGFSQANYDNFENNNIIDEGQSNEERIIFKYPMNLSNYKGVNLMEGISIPFQCQIPNDCYPTCIIESNAFIIHFLIINFDSINTIKTTAIVIKNNIYYTSLNKLYKSPVICKLETSKHTYAIFNKGSFSASIKLPKNRFAYDEIVPFLIDLNCSELSIDIKSIQVSLNLILRVKNNLNHDEIKFQKIKEIVSKYIPLTNGEKIYSIDDMIKLPSTSDNPKIVYNKLDSDKREFSEKFNNIYLFPTCYGGILNCEYRMRITFEMSSLFSTNEFLEIPLDFYEIENFNNQNENNFQIQNSQQNNMINQNYNIETPLGNNKYENSNIKDNYLNYNNPSNKNIINNSFNYLNNNLINSQNQINDNNKNKIIENKPTEDSVAPPLSNQNLSNINNNHQ